MNKKEFIKELSNKTGYSVSDCEKINDILDNNFIIGKKNKDKIIKDLISSIDINEEKAEEIYNFSMTIIWDELKEKLKHPFKSID